MTPMPCRSYTPEHKGKVERGVGYAKNNALKGRVRLAGRAERPPAPLGGAGGRQAHARHHPAAGGRRCFRRNARHLGPLPLEFTRAIRKAAAGSSATAFVEVAKAYYEAPPEFIGRQVWARWDGRMVRLLNDRMEQIGCTRAAGTGRVQPLPGRAGCTAPSSKVPTTGRTRAPPPWARRRVRWARRALDARGAEAIRSIMGLCQLAEKRRASDINAACAKAMAAAANLPAFRKSNTCWKPAAMHPDRAKWSCAKPIRSSVRSPPTPTHPQPRGTDFSHPETEHGPEP
jgi:hypothetical protein